MYKYALIFCVVLAAAYASEVIEPSEALPEDGAQRFFATTTTTTVYVVTSTVAVSSVTKTCASTSNVTGTCRRRRGIEEQPLLLALDDDVNVAEILPAQPEAVVASVAAELPKDAAQVAEAVPNKAEVEASEDLVTVDIIGLSAPCQQQRFLTSLTSLFGLTIRYTTTSTVTSTSYVSATVATKTYVVVGCTPSGFSTALC